MGAAGTVVRSCSYGSSSLPDFPSALSAPGRSGVLKNSRRMYSRPAPLLIPMRNEFEPYRPKFAYLIDRNRAQQFEIAEHFSGSQHHRRQRIVGNRYRQPGLFADALVEVLEQRAAAG